MFNCNDAWFMNESLAFYTSTNTFTNPIFNSTDIDDILDQENSQDYLASNKKQKPPKYQNEAKSQAEAAIRQRGTSLCDSLAFSFKTKLYVLELNFKRKMQHLKRFTSRTMPWLLANNRSIKKSKSSERGDQFWLDFEPSAGKMFGAQKEKILQRLERAIELKKSKQEQEDQLFNMRRTELYDGILYVRPTRKRSPMSSSPSSISSLSAQSSCLGRSSSIASGLKTRNNNKPLTNSKKANSKHKTKWSDTGSSLSKLCIICYTNLPNIVTLPCKHDEICSDCFIELIYMAVKHSQYPLKCVLCRQKIEKIKCSKSLLLSVIEKNRIRP